MDMNQWRRVSYAQRLYTADTKPLFTSPRLAAARGAVRKTSPVLYYHGTVSTTLSTDYSDD